MTRSPSNLRSEEYFRQHLPEIGHLIEVKIGHELNLINHRISWLASSQAFLFLAVATLLTTLSKPTHQAVVVFLFGIPMAGFVLCLQVLRSVNAAFSVLERHLLQERKLITDEINGICGTDLAPLGPDRLTDFVGALPAKWIPSTFMVSWVVVLGLLVWLVKFPL